MKFKKALDEFAKWKTPQVKGNTIYGYYWQLVHFGEILKDKDIEKITINDIVEHIHWLEYYKHSGSTIEKFAIAIKNLLQYYEMKGLRVENPGLVPKIKKDRVMPRVANESDYYKVLNVIPTSGYNHIRNKAIVALLYDSGARLNEILSLNIQDIDVEKKHITIRTEKHSENSPFRNIFYREQTIVYLNTWIKKRERLLKTLSIEDKDALFISVRGGVCGEGTEARRTDIAAMGEVLRKYSKQAGLQNTFNAHSLRHRFGRVLAEKRVDDLLIAQFMGHRNVDSSRIYTELFGPVLHRIYNKVMGK